MPLDLKNLDQNEKTTTVKTKLGDFEVTFNPTAAKRKWQTRMTKLQRDLGTAAQRDNNEDEEAEIAEELGEHLRQLITDWDLTSEGEKLPVSSETLDEMPLSVQSEMFTQVITEAAGGDSGNSKRRS